MSSNEEDRKAVISNKVRLAIIHKWYCSQADQYLQQREQSHPVIRKDDLTFKLLSTPEHPLPTPKDSLLVLLPEIRNMVYDIVIRDNIRNALRKHAVSGARHPKPHHVPSGLRLNKQIYNEALDLATHREKTFASLTSLQAYVAEVQSGGLKVPEDITITIALTSEMPAVILLLRQLGQRCTGGIQALRVWSRPNPVWRRTQHETWENVFRRHMFVPNLLAYCGRDGREEYTSLRGRVMRGGVIVDKWVAFP